MVVAVPGPDAASDHIQTPLMWASCTSAVRERNGGEKESSLLRERGYVREKTWERERNGRAGPRERAPVIFFNFKREVRRDSA